MQQHISVLLYTTNQCRQIVSVTPAANAETITYNLCKELKVQPAFVLLFGLRLTNNGSFVAPNRPVVAGEKYELRMRFQISDLAEMKRTDKIALDYFYQQVKCDLIALRVRGLEYPNLKEQVAGLCVTFMYIDMLDKGLTFEHQMSNYKKYVPEKYRKEHFMFIKGHISKKLKDTIKGNYESL